MVQGQSQVFPQFRGLGEVSRRPSQILEEGEESANKSLDNH